MLRKALVGLGLHLFLGSVLFATNDDDRLVGKGPAAIVSVRVNSSAPAAFGKFELAIDLDAEYQNPFDPTDVALEGHFIMPDGQEQIVPGFLWWECERSQQGDSKRWEQVRPTGKAEWRVRYCPAMPGDYRYWLVLNDGITRVQTEPASFSAFASEHAGMVRIAKDNPLYFEHDDGTRGSQCSGLGRTGAIRSGQQLAIGLRRRPGRTARSETDVLHRFVQLAADQA